MTPKSSSSVSSQPQCNLTLPRDYVVFLEFPLTDRVYAEQVTKAYCLVDNQRTSNPIKKIRGELRVFVRSRDGKRFSPYYQHANYLISFQPNQLKRIVEYIRGSPDNNSEENELSLHTLYDEVTSEPILHLMQTVAGYGDERAATIRNFYLSRQEATSLARQYDKSNHDEMAQSAIRNCESAGADPRSIQHTSARDMRESALEMVSAKSIVKNHLNVDLANCNDSVFSQKASPTLIKPDENTEVFTEPPASPTDVPIAAKKRKKRVLLDDDSAEIDIQETAGVAVPSKRTSKRKKTSQQQKRANTVPQLD